MIYRRILSFTYFLLFTLIMAGCAQSKKITFERDFNFEWKFSLMDSLDVAYQNNFDDSNWKTVQLPHDWSIESPFDSIKGDGATGYLPGGRGWYRKHFDMHFQKNEVVSVLFDGVYNRSEIWVNAKKVGAQKYGYAPFKFDITKYLNKNGKGNIISVKVNHSRSIDSRWYTGSGIYRNVKLIKTNKLHIPIWGTYITTPEVSKSFAKVHLQVALDNQYSTTQIADIITRIYDHNNNLVLELINENKYLKPQNQIFYQEGEIEAPRLWSPKTPHLYKAITSVYVNNELFDEHSTIFGIRRFRFDPELGFFLNGENIKIKGVNIHHDAGLVGAAVPKNVWIRRLKKLKEMGANAIRSAHNPASQEFLDVCDELGFLVQDEFFDEWDYPKDKRLNVWERHDDYISRGLADHFRETAEKDLKNTVLAHRNHPSIFQWSIGNEIEWTYPNVKAATGYYKGDKRVAQRRWAEPPNTPEQIGAMYKSLPSSEFTIGNTAQKLANWTRQLDTTRFITANCIIPTGSFETGYTDALDVVGFSYRQAIYDYAHRNYPNKPVMGTENWGQWHEWKAALDRPFVAGVFLWTGIDYLGEASGKWPKKGSGSGLLDLAGFEKPRYHMFKSLWNNEPHIYISSQKLKDSEYEIDSKGKISYKKKEGWKFKTWKWQDVNEHWNYVHDEQIIVEVISNIDSVELFLNDQSLGMKYLSDFPDRIYKWLVPFREGKLVAKNQKMEATIQTALEPATILLTTDKKQLNSDGYDVAHIIARLFDKKGNPVLHSNKKITFSIQGNVRSLGVDNGSNTNPGPYNSNTVITNNGIAMLIVQSNKGAKGAVKVKALGNVLSSNAIELNFE